MIKGFQGGFIMCHCKMLYQIATITKKVTILYLRLCPKKTDKLSAWTIVRRELSAQNGIEMEINNNNNSLTIIIL